MTLDAAAARDAVPRLGEELGLGVPELAEGIVVGDQREDGAGDPDAHGRAGDRAARLRSRRLRRRRPDARRLPRAGARDRRGDRAAARRRVLGVGDARDRAPPRLHAAVLPPGERRRSRRARARSARRPLPRGARRSRPRASPAADCRVEHSVDMRYEAQEYTLAIPIDRPDAPREPGFVEEMVRRFNEAHDFRYGHSNPGAPVEFVSLRAAAFGDLGHAEPEELAAAASAAAGTRTRDVLFDGRRAADRDLRPRGAAPWARRSRARSSSRRRRRRPSCRRAARCRSTGTAPSIISIGKEA